MGYVVVANGQPSAQLLPGGDQLGERVRVDERILVADAYEGAARSALTECGQPRRQRSRTEHHICRDVRPERTDGYYQRRRLAIADDRRVGEYGDLEEARRASDLAIVSARELDDPLEDVAALSSRVFILRSEGDMESAQSEGAALSQAADRLYEQDARCRVARPTAVVVFGPTSWKPRA